jgi:phospholipid/cholesterol/gamma-HCH transport system substrate-binding protein
MFDMKKQLRWWKLKVGVVITLACLVLVVAIFFAEGIEKIFSPKIDLKVQFQDVRGLRKGGPVWIFGTEVGSVKEIQLDRTIGAVVTVSVKKSVQGFIKKDARASIMTMGLLGDKYIELNTGSPKAEPIERGEMIKGSVPVEISEVMETAGVSIGKIGDFIAKLDNLILKIEKGEGTLAKFLSDPSIYDNLNRGVKALSLTLEEIRTSKGTFKMLLDDPSLYQRLVSAVSSIEEVAKKTDDSVGEITKKISESRGTLKKLVEDPLLYDKALETVTSLDQFSRRLNQETGTLKRLMEDPQLYDNLNEGAVRLTSMLKRIEEGEGVAGALLKEKELIKDLEETLDEFKGAAGELKELLKDIKASPKKYFKFSIF